MQLKKDLKGEQTDLRLDESRQEMGELIDSDPEQYWPDQEDF